VLVAVHKLAAVAMGGLSLELVPVPVARHILAVVAAQQVPGVVMV